MRLLTATVKRNRFEQRNRNRVARKLPEQSEGYLLILSKKTSCSSCYPVKKNIQLFCLKKSRRIVRKDFLFILILIAIGGAVYLQTLDAGFVYDDLVTVEENLFIRDWTNLSRFLSSDYYLRSEEYSFRPLVTLTYFIDYSIWRNNPAGYHLTNLFIHLAAAAGAYLLARRLGAGKWAGRLTALFFLLHPVQSEAVAGISFREDPLAGLFFILSLLTYLRRKRPKEISSHFPPAGKGEILTGSPAMFFSLLFFLLALLAKEMAVTLPLIILTYEITINKKSFRAGLVRSAPFFLIGLLYGLARLSILYQGGSLPAAPAFGDPLTRLFLAWKSLGLCGNLVFFPFPLAVEYPDPLPFFTWSYRLVAAALLTVAFLFAAGAAGRNRPREQFGLIFFFLALLPVLNLIPAARLGADRFLYLPLFGICFWGGEILTPTGHNRLLLRTALPAFLIAALLAAATISQNRFWQNNLVVFRRAVRVSPRSSKAHHGLGNEYFRQAIDAANRNRPRRSHDYLQRAIFQFKEAIDIFRREPLYYNSLGVAYGQLGEFNRARNAFRTSARLNPGDPLVLMNLATLNLRQGDTDQALKRIREYISLVPFDPKGFINLGEIHLTRREIGKAFEAYRQALQKDPGSPMAREGFERCRRLLGNQSPGPAGSRSD